MRMKHFIGFALLFPLMALALEIEPGDFYDDVRPASPEAPGINLLTREGVVQGYGDRKFGPSRQVNRAEFVKIAMLSVKGDFGPVLNRGCFPDVRESDWFSVHVCGMKQESLVKGYPDGLFHPERTVQYDEALKILTLLFGYDIPPLQSGEDWGEPYYGAAKARGTDLPITIEFAMPLTRAHTARLAAAFLAESEGELEHLRMAESGNYDFDVSSSSSLPSFSSSSSSSTSSFSSSGEASPATSFYTIPPVSHFLLVGSRTDAIADIVVNSPGERTFLAAATVKLFTESRSLENLELTLEDGTVVATLLKRTTTTPDDYKLTYEVQVIPENQYAMPKDGEVRFVLRGNVKSIENSGFSDELVHVRTVNLTTRGEQTNETKNPASLGPFPKHQTAFGKLLSVKRTSTASDKIVSASGTIMNTFTVSGTGASTKSLSVRNFVFTLQKTGGVTSANWKLKRAGQLPHTCTMNEQEMTVSCLNLPEAVGSVPHGDAAAFELIADIQVPSGSTDSSLQADFADPGSPERFGAIEWTDSSGVFKWVEGPTPLMRGTRWQ